MLGETELWIAFCISAMFLALAYQEKRRAARHRIIPIIYDPDLPAGVAVIIKSDIYKMIADEMLIPPGMLKDPKVKDPVYAAPLPWMFEREFPNNDWIRRTESLPWNTYAEDVSGRRCVFFSEHVEPTAIERRVERYLAEGAHYGLTWTEWCIMQKEKEKNENTEAR